MSITLDDIEQQYEDEHGYYPQTVQKVLSYCKENNYSFTFRDVNKWWKENDKPTSKLPSTYSKSVNLAIIYSKQQEIDTVNGYINEGIQKEVPSVIKDICHSYYRNFEYFPIFGNNIDKVNGSDFKVSNETSQWNTAYTSNKININKYPNSSFKWTVRITYHNPEMHEVDWGGRMAPKYAGLQIGIDSKKDKRRWANGNFYQLSPYDKPDKDPNYSIYSTGGLCHHEKGSISRFGYYYFREAIYDGDEIGFEMNCKEKIMKYYKNGKDHGRAFINTHLMTDSYGREVEYCFAVAFHGATIEITDFERRLI